MHFFIFTHNAFRQIISLESALMEAETERDRQSKAARNAREKLSELEKDRKELADEYVVLKTNYLNTQKAYQRVVRFKKNSSFT